MIKFILYNVVIGEKIKVFWYFNNKINLFFIFILFLYLDFWNRVVKSVNYVYLFVNDLFVMMKNIGI